MTQAPEPTLPPEDSKAAYARNAAVMTVGTTLSRFTGFLRIAAQTAALGVTASALADTYNKANTTPNIIYELALGGILTSVFVPLFVEWMQTQGRDASWEVADRMLTLALVGLGGIGSSVRSSPPGSSGHTTWRRTPAGTRRPHSSRSAPSSCGGSCRRSCSTGSGRSPAAC